MSAESVLCVKHGSQIYMFAELHPYPSRVIVHFLKKNEEEQKIIARKVGQAKEGYSGKGRAAGCVPERILYPSCNVGRNRLESVLQTPTTHTQWVDGRTAF